MDKNGMIEAKVSRRFEGAFFVETRHLQQLDEILSKYSVDDERKSVAVSLQNARSFRAKSFSELSSMEVHPILDRLSIVSMDGEVEGRLGFLSIALSRSGITAQGKFSDEDAEVFERSVAEFAARVRAPYYFLFAKGWRQAIDFGAQMLFVILVFTLILPRANLPQGVWYILLYGGIVSAFSQAAMGFVKSRLPPLIVLIGEGVRLKDRRLTIWRWLLPRALWQMLLWVIGVIALYLLARR